MTSTDYMHAFSIDRASWQGKDAIIYYGDHDYRFIVKMVFNPKTEWSDLDVARVSAKFTSPHAFGYSQTFSFSEDYNVYVAFDHLMVFSIKFFENTPDQNVLNIYDQLGDGY